VFFQTQKSKATKLGKNAQSITVAVKNPNNYRKANKSKK
jgi:hypothetical protein